MKILPSSFVKTWQHTPNWGRVTIIVGAALLTAGTITASTAAFCIGYRKTTDTIVKP